MSASYQRGRNALSDVKKKTKKNDALLCSASVCYRSYYVTGMSWASSNSIQLLGDIMQIGKSSILRRFHLSTLQSPPQLRRQSYRRGGRACVIDVNKKEKKKKKGRGLIDYLDKSRVLCCPRRHSDLTQSS